MQLIWLDFICLDDSSGFSSWLVYRHVAAKSCERNLSVVKVNHFKNDFAARWHELPMRLWVEMLLTPNEAMGVLLLQHSP